MIDIVAGVALSLHVGLPYDYNAVHPFVEVEYNSVSIGVYKNSINNPSFYITYTHDYGNAFIEGGLVTGYVGSDVTPYARVGYKLSPNLVWFAAPAYDAGHIGAVTGIELRF